MKKSCNVIDKVERHTVFPLRLNHFRYAPDKVTTALAISVVSVWFAKNYLTRKYEQYSYGEDFAQYSSRKKVLSSCQKLEHINLKVLLNPEEGIEIKKLNETCMTARKFLDTMPEVMKERRKLKIGDQRFFGNRRDACFDDQYNESTKRYIPRETITNDIDWFEEKVVRRMARFK